MLAMFSVEPAANSVTRKASTTSGNVPTAAQRKAIHGPAHSGTNSERRLPSGNCITLPRQYPPQFLH